MDLYTIYRDPSDYPGLYVTRRFVCRGGAPVAEPTPLYVGPSLEEARVAALRASGHVLERVGRDPTDPLAVLETWL